MPDQLKPCPFCGGLPIKRKDKTEGDWCIGVHRPDCFLYVHYHHITFIKKAIDDWNSRPVEEGLRAELAQKNTRIMDLGSRLLEMQKIARKFEAENKRLRDALEKLYNAFKRSNELGCNAECLSGDCECCDVAIGEKAAIQALEGKS